MTPTDPEQSAIEAHLGLVDDAGTEEALTTPDAETLAWADHLSPFYAALPPVQPNPRLWQRIERSSRPRSAPSTGPWMWQALAAGLAVVSLGLGWQLVSRPQPAVSFPAAQIAEAPAPAPILTAGLAGAAAEPGRLAFVMATADDGAFIRSAPATARTVPGRTYNLWLVAPDQKIFVGHVSAEIQHSVPVPVPLRGLIHEGARLEVSLDAGDQPPFQPGLIVASGELTAIPLRG